MGQITFPVLVKLIIGLIYKDEGLLTKTQSILQRHFGDTDYASPIIPFTYTNYYEEEIGTQLKRKFLSFHKLIPPEQLANIKNYTNKLEVRFSQNNLRKINIDPGYLTMAKLVLASTKDYSHRIYITKGIFAENTLVYQDKNFHPWPWTYPDYKSSEYMKFFLKIRELYALQIKKI